MPALASDHSFLRECWQVAAYGSEVGRTLGRRTLAGDDLRLTEHSRRVDKTTLVVDVTATNPIAFTTTMTTHVTFTASTDPHWEPRDVLCTPATDFDPDQYIH